MGEIALEAPSKRRLKKFGPEGALIGAICEAAGETSSTGAILWGLGVAELRTARRLARYGIPSLQVRIGGSAFSNLEHRMEVYRSSGTEYCRAAMDYLNAERGSDSFLIMGNCATANLCFAAALSDPRVTGLILTNPHVDSVDVLRTSLIRKMLRLRTWRNFLGGRGFRLRRGVSLLRRLAERKAGARGGSGTAGYDDPSQGLPHHLGRLLRQLCDRGVSILLVCAREDDSFHVLTKKHAETLRDLQETASLTFECVEADAHVFSTDDAAALLLNETISRWIDNVYARDIARGRGAA